MPQVHQAALRCAQLSAACSAAGAAATSAGSADEVAAGRAAVLQHVAALQGERDARQQVSAALQALLRAQVRGSGLWGCMRAWVCVMMGKGGGVLCEVAELVRTCERVCIYVGAHSLGRVGRH